jgi:hypothetical protein
MNALGIIFKVLFVIGLLLIVVDLTKTYYKAPPNKTIYRYIPRTFVEEQENPVPLDDIFYQMFNNPTPWVASVDVQRRKSDIGENINKYYLTQI